MKICFLDFDGVINVLEPYRDKYGKYKLKLSGDKLKGITAINWLNYICQEYDLKIVISSSWRIGRSFEQLKNILYSSGLDKSIEILAVTPRSPDAYRGTEIKMFLDTKKYDIEDFIIIDDDKDIEPYSDHLIQTNSMVGITCETFIKVRSYFQS